MDDLRVDETQLDTNTETVPETDIIVEADEQLDIEVDQTTDIDTIGDPNILDFYTALEGWFWKKLQKLVAKVFLSISRFCLSEASANLSAYADVFVLALEYNPYKYFKCVNIINAYSEFVTCLAITPDGQRLISGSWWDNPLIKIWNLNTGELISTLEAHKHYINCVAITPDGQTLVSTGRDSTFSESWDRKHCDSTINIWDLKTNELLDSLYSPKAFFLVAITPDGQKFISSEIGERANIKIWDLKNLKILKSWLTYSSQNRYDYGYYTHNKCIVISPDQQRIIVGRKIIKSYDLITGKLRTIIGCNLGWIYALAITPDGKILISSHDNNTIKIWDLTKKYPDIRLTLNCSAEEVQALTLTPDGQKNVSAGCSIINDDYESFIEIWDLNTGELLHSIKEYLTSDSHAYCLAITPDGKQIITGHGDGTIRIWGIPELSL